MLQLSGFSAPCSNEIPGGLEIALAGILEDLAVYLSNILRSAAPFLEEWLHRLRMLQDSVILLPRGCPCPIFQPIHFRLHVLVSIAGKHAWQVRGQSCTFLGKEVPRAEKGAYEHLEYL